MLRNPSGRSNCAVALLSAILLSSLVLGCGDDSGAMDAGTRDSAVDGDVIDSGPMGCDPVPTWYADPDGDGFGDPDDAIEACVQPGGYVAHAEMVTSVEFDVSALSLALGTGSRTTVELIYDSGRREDVTARAEWMSNDMNVATVGNGELAAGIVTAVGMGTTTIRVSFGGVEATLTVTVTEPQLLDVVVTPGLENALFAIPGVSFEAFATYTDGSQTNVTELADWTSSDDSVGKVGDISFAEWMEADRTGMPIEYRPKGYFFMGTFNFLVDPPQPRTAGTATVTAMFMGSSASATIIVQDDTLDSIFLSAVDPILLNQSVRLDANGVFSSGSLRSVSADATWSSSDPGAISVSRDADGVVTATANGPGSADIQACVDTVCGTQTVEVNARVFSALAILSDRPDILLGTSLRLKAVARYADGLEQDVTSFVTWDISDPDLVAADAEPTGGFSVFEGSFANAYTLRGVRTGLVQISATLPTGPGVSETSTRGFGVRAPQLVSLEVRPRALTIPVFDTSRFRAIGTYEDGSVQDVSAQAHWVVDDETVLVPSGAGSSAGELSGVGGGDTTVRATFQAFSANAMATVVDDIASLAIAPVHPETGEPYPSPYRTGTLVQFIGRATLVSGGVVDVPLAGYEWDVPIVTDAEGSWRPLLPLGDGIFRVSREMAALITAQQTLADGRTLSASYLFNAELDVVDELVVDPPNPIGGSHTVGNVTERYFRILARYRSGREIDVTGEALDVTATPLSSVTFGGTPEVMDTPGDVLRTSYWEFVDLNEGFTEDPTGFPSFSAEEKAAPTVTTRRFNAPVDISGNFDITFGYGGATRTVTARFENIQTLLVGAFDPADFESHTVATAPPEILRISGVDGFLIKDLDPTYRASLNMMEDRARALAPTIDEAMLRAGLEAVGGLTTAELDALVADLVTAVADEEVRNGMALLVEFMKLFATPAADRSDAENNAVAWIGQSVHDARVNTARFALDEYERWNEDPWSYEAPQGFAYVTPRPDATALQWSFGYPDPPDLVSLAQSGVAPQLALSEGARAALVVGAFAVASVATTAAFLTATAQSVLAVVLPFARTAAVFGAAAGSIVGTVLVTIIVTALEAIRVAQNAELPNELQTIIDDTIAEAVPDADVLATTDQGLRTAMAAVLVNM